jgi:hypothetical protein
MTVSRSRSAGSKAFAKMGPVIPLAIALLHGALVPPNANSVSLRTSSAGLASSSLGDDIPLPLIAKGHPVDWWFVFKFNSASFPGCGGSAKRECLFGGNVKDYKAFGQQFVYASSEDSTLQQGSGCAGDTTEDPVGATFDEVYSNSFNYVIWNDQFYDDPKIQGCGASCSSPWGHSKGILAWNDLGQGFVMQVTTPSWPAAGSSRAPRRTDGNTLGCVKDNDVQVSQHFFALELTKDDLLKVLAALQNASVVTNPHDPQIVRNGGPEDVQNLVDQLGSKSNSKEFTKDVLSTGVQLISKPSRLDVPPWQLVSSVLGGIALRTATWWANPKIYSTTSATDISCWDPSLSRPGPVEIATTGNWKGKEFGLMGGLGSNSNHAKVGVSIASTDSYSILGDMNQQGTLSGPNCSSSQNGRGGLFYVIEDTNLSASVTALINGKTAPTEAPQP